ncbi:MAG TPA: tRNA (N(6)-L-threonylcarbamoyladenosine(37)-C(2))-methylthiotransferase MtaB [Spirochaetia bacterium]|nr:tRNA (N(6)-L-threonylcarbamoyladenosine(37)-C(2))-methylthiotransferase MtaB [Spirochaetia bacterium]
MRIGFHTFGCKLNQYETEALASSFRGHGHTVVSALDDADAYVINTCTVTGRADHKSRAAVRGLSRKHPESLLIVTGCSAQLEARALSALGGNIVVVPQSAKADLLVLAERIAEEQDIRAGLARLRDESSPAVPDPFAFRVDTLSFHTRAFLKIQDGCDGLCAYCRVPQARGAATSLDVEEVIRRATALESQGHREIVVTGVNLSAYRSRGIGLPRLVGELTGATRRVRFRLSSLEPESLTEDLALNLRHERICAHFHVPVQSGSNAVLQRMKRRYRAERVVEGAGLLRAAKEAPFLAADFIVGFPGETQEDHAMTVGLIERLGLAALHVFPYSARPGTAAAGFRPRVPQRVRDQRARQLGDMSRGLLDTYARSWLGKDVEVLLESSRRRQEPEAPAVSGRGVSENYLKVIVEDLPAESNGKGKIARARIVHSGETCRAAFLGFA